MSQPKRIVIMGAAGRDFHNFNVCYRDNPDFEVVAFTAYQIPNIAGRTYPAELAGPRYPKGIPIREEKELAGLIRQQQVDEVVFSYSDVPHVEVMHRASLVTANGADFRLLGAEATMLQSQKPVVSVCAVRTGCGKSQTSRRVAEHLARSGKKVVVIRHPMPYGDLLAQRCQRFADMEDLVKHQCTIEEREEYEGHIQLGHVVYAGVDYADILVAAEREAEVLLWDGGNNDTPFYRSDLHIVMLDPLRPGHERLYYPGETNLLTADVLIVNKVGSALPEDLEAVKETARRYNPAARLVEADSTVSVEDPSLIRGKRVLVIEDGPTVTHGEMPYGAGHVAAKRWGAAEILDPRPHAVGSIAQTYKDFPHLLNVLPAMGYGRKQVEELRETIERSPCELVLVGTPFDLPRLIQTEKTMMRVRYELEEKATQTLNRIVDEFLDRRRSGRAEQVTEQ